MTGTSIGPPPPPPPPPTGLTAPPPPPARHPPPSRLRRALRDTPGRMRLVAVALVAVGLLVGLAAAQSFASASAALERAGDNATQLVRLQEIQNSLVRADADATNAFLVGGLEPLGLRTDYADAIRRAGEQLAYAARAQPADGDALAALTTAVQRYVGTIELARGNNRQAFPVGAQYLRDGGAGLRADALPLLDALEQANAARAEAEFAAASRAWIVVVVVGALGLGAIAVASVWLARRTHRYLNAPVVAGAGVVLVVLVAGAVVLGSVAGTVGAVRSGSYASARALSDARIAAFDAKANESLTLISRGSGAVFDEAWTASAATTATRLADAAAIDAAAADLEPTWTAYTDLHGEIRDLDEGGDWDAAVNAATAQEGGSANAAFATFDQASGARLDEASDATSTALDGAATGLVLGAWLGVVAGLGVAVLAWWGLAQRMEEYR